MERKLNTCRQALLSTHPLYPPMIFHLFVYTRRPYAWPLNELINFLNFVNHVTRQNGIVFIYFRWPCRLYSNTQLYMFYIFPLVIQWSNTAVYLHNFCVALPAKKKNSASPSSPLLPVPSICFRLVYPCLGDRSCFVPARPSSRSRRHNCVRTAEQWQDRHTPRWASSQVRISAVTISTKSL